LTATELGRLVLVLTSGLTEVGVSGFGSVATCGSGAGLALSLELVSGAVGCFSAITDGDDGAIAIDGHRRSAGVPPPPPPAATEPPSFPEPPCS